MSTLPPPDLRKTPDDQLEKKVYEIVESLSEYLPITNDRNRLGFMLYKNVMGEGDDPGTIVKTAKVIVEGITLENLAQKIKAKLDQLKSAK